MTIQLSICIPTYNRAEFICETLDGVIAQATEGVEIVVCDNASSDNTEQLVRARQTLFPRLTYFRQPKNEGFDRNLLKAVELARGEYCWLLGSDDKLAEGAVETAINALGSSDIYLADRINMSVDMKQEKSREKMLGLPPGRFDCSDPREILRYLSGAVSLGSLFSYMSCIIVRRDAWEKQPIPAEFIGIGWIHAAKVFALMDAGKSMSYLAQFLVHNRTDNDSSYASVGYTRRRLLDLDFPKVIAGCISDIRVADAVREVVAKQFFNWRVLLSDKLSSLRGDGPDGPLLLLKAYQREFARMRWFRAKIFLFARLNVRSLQFLQSFSRNLSLTSS